MFSYLLVVAFLPAVVFGHHHIVPCPGGLPTPTGIRIAGCSQSPCPIRQGDLVSYEVDFSAAHASSGLTLSVSANVLGQNRVVPLPPGAENVCNSLIVGACPVASGQSLTHGTTIPVFTEYHGGIPAQLRIEVEHTAVGRHHHTCFCTLVNFIIH